MTHFKKLTLLVCASLLLSTATAQDKMMPFSASAYSPQGWLKGMQDRAIEGYTGHMEKYSEPNDEMRFPLNTWAEMPYEEMPWGDLEAEAYYLDGLARLAYISKDQELITKVKGVIDAIVENQQEDGFFFTPSKRDSFHKVDLEQGLEDPKYTYKDDGEIGSYATSEIQRHLPSQLSRDYWATAVLNRGILALYDASGEEKYIQFLKKFYDYMPEFVREVSLDAAISGTEMHFLRHLVNLETLFEVAERLDDKELAKKGARILKNHESGMYRSFLANDFDYARVCHGVTFNEVSKVFAATNMINNKKYIEAVENAYDFLQREHFQPYGVNSANEYLQGIGAFNSTELCDIVDMMWSSTWLARNTAKSKYGDIIEKGFFNAMPASTDEYNTHVYVFSPNRIPGTTINYRGSRHDYRDSYHPPCCTGNINRGLPIFIQSMVMRADKRDLAFVTYAPNKFDGELGGEKVSFTTTTNYPFDDKIEISVDRSINKKCKLYFRIPSWCKDASVAVNGTKQELEINDKGFVAINREWAKGDKISLQFPMECEVIASREIKLIKPGTAKEQYVAPGTANIKTSAEVAAGRPFAYVMRGPLLYALNGEATSVNQIKDPNWDYSYALSPNTTDFKVSTSPLNNSWAWDVDSPPIKIEIAAQSIDWKVTPQDPQLPDSQIKNDPAQSQKITLVPYGCTRFRVASFPILER
ncbi:MAG: glycoside hydrolase family 127 protein [Rikenellaceae bacterium]